MQYQHVRRAAPLLAEAFLSARVQRCLQRPRRSAGTAAARHDRSWQNALHGRQRRFPVLLMSGLLGISAAFAVGMGIAGRDALRQHIVDGSVVATIPAPQTTAAAPTSAPPSGAEPQGAAMPMAPAASTLVTTMPPRPATKNTKNTAAPRSQRTTHAARPAPRPAAKVAARPATSNRVATASAVTVPARAASTSRADGPARAERSAAPARKPRHDEVAQYAQCTRLDSFLAREKCKWRVCGGKWGSQGCPSYQHKAPPGVGIGMGMGMTEFSASTAG